MLSDLVKLGIVHFMVYPKTIRGEGPILETLNRLALDPSFDLVEVTWIKDPGVRKKARELLEESGLEVKYGAQPRLLTTGLDLNSFDDTIREQAIKTVKEGVDEALELGATSLALLSGKNVPEARRGEAKDLLIDSLGQLCEYAKSHQSGFPIVLEPFDHHIDKKALIGPTQDAVEVARSVREDHKNFGLLLDLSHLPLLGEKPREALTQAREYLVHAHIGNCVLRDSSNPAWGDKHPRFGTEEGENGVEELAEFLSVLFEIGYLGGGKRNVVSFEVQPMAGEDPELVIAHSKRTLARAWSMMKR